MIQYFSKPYKHSGKNAKIILGLCNSATNANLTGVIGIDTSMFVSKTDLACLQIKVDKLDVDKLKTVPAALGKLSNVIYMDVLKRLCMINLLSKLMLLMLKYHVLMN